MSKVSICFFFLSIALWTLASSAVTVNISFLTTFFFFSPSLPSSSISSSSSCSGTTPSSTLASSSNSFSSLNLLTTSAIPKVGTPLAKDFNGTPGSLPNGLK